MKSLQHNIHCIAWCTGCDKEWEMHTTSRKKAYDHARKTGHTVKGEIGFAFQYN